jgi:hypothetical protein
VSLITNSFGNNLNILSIRSGAWPLTPAIHEEGFMRRPCTPTEIGAALGISAADATKLLTRHQWREGDVALLEAAAARLGVQVPGMPGEPD